MTVFKAFLKVLNKNKAIVIMYTVILIFFAGFNMKTNDNNTTFTASKPDILIVCEDEITGITKNLIEYISKNSNIKEIENDEEKRNDALFYRDVNYIVYIPNDFRKQFLNHQNPEIKIKSTKDYQASLANMMLERFLNVANIYLAFDLAEEEMLNAINETLEQEVNVEVTSKLDTDSLTKVSSYYNFTNYCILAGAIYIICLILSSFKKESVLKRTTISSMEYQKYNRVLLLSNSLFAFAMWFFYVLLSYILFKESMWTLHGAFYILNSFVFSFFALTLAFFLGNIISDKNALNGIINVIALGSSFLCGAFVPLEWLPKTVLNIAHILPSYYFIKSNEVLKTVEVFDFASLKPIYLNMMILLLFALAFIIASMIITNKKRKLA